MSDYKVCIDGIDVSFPYKPYSCQTKFMGCVVGAIKGQKNALLESPTGTGKTLALLCSSFGCLKDARTKASVQESQTSSDGGQTQTLASLANILRLENSIGRDTKFLNKPRSTPLRVIYSSRTHAQLKQVIQEAKKTSYASSFPKLGFTSVILGSRDQMCVNPERGNLSGDALNNFCRTQCKKNRCMYYNGSKNPRVGDEIKFYEFMDIEDLVSLCKSKRCCPYYASRDVHETAAFTFLPYNYLLSPKSRSSMDIKLSNAIVLIDEAHNIERTAEESASFKIRQIDVAKYMGALRRFASFYKEYLQSSETTNDEKTTINISALSKLAVALNALDKFLSHVELKAYDAGTTTPKRSEDGRVALESWQIESIEGEHCVYKATHFVPFMNNGLGFGGVLGKTLNTALANAQSLLTTRSPGMASNVQSFYDDFKAAQDDCAILENLNDVVTQYYSDEVQRCPEYFHIYISKEQQYLQHQSTSPKGRAGTGWSAKLKTKTSQVVPKVLWFECLQATPSFLRLVAEGVKSIIMTSGTLSPMEQMEQQVGGGRLQFEIKLANEHVIDPSRIWAGIVSGTRQDPYALVSDFNRRTKFSFVSALGESLHIFMQTVPRGVLVFFGSYPFMESTIKFWKQFGIYSKLESCKTLFIEERGQETKSKSVQSQLSLYKREIDAKRGAAFIGVCRGKIAEGIDFPDDYCRGVFMCGIPYPNRYEVSTAMKIDYLDRSDNKGHGFSHDWYTGQAIRAINQAVGRAIRHVDDYGSILLADARFKNNTFRQRLSSWVRNKIKVHDNMEAATKELMEFFKQHTETKRPIHVHDKQTGQVVPLAQQPNDTLEFKVRKINYSNVPKPDIMWRPAYMASPSRPLHSSSSSSSSPKQEKKCALDIIGNF